MSRAATTRTLLLALALVVAVAGPTGATGGPDLAATIREAAARYPAPDAHIAVGDAFLRFETSPTDADLKARDPSLYVDLEVRWLALVAAMKSGTSASEVRAQAEALAAMLDRVAGARAASGGSSVFVDALLIILREGFEALLVLTALAAYLVRVQQGDKRWLLYAGAGGAVVASLALAVIARSVMPVEGAAREALEGVTMLLAAVVLFTASFWLISRSEAQRWQAFVREKLEGALTSRRRVGLVVLSFLVVFREGFETVLFYEALLARAANAGGGASMVWSGFLLGLGLLAIIGVALFRYGIRIPIRPFFATTGVLLYLLAFKFTGGGVRELQEAGLVSVTAAPIPNVAWLRDWLAIYPFVEPLAAQGVLVLAVVAGVIYTLATRRGSGVEAPAAAQS